jgi:hypothetical protein
MIKRGQGMSVQTIVVFALAVLVLIVLAMIFIGRYSAGRQQIEFVANPLEYKAACLAKYPRDNAAYENCVKQCEEAAKNKQFLEQCKLEE